MVKTGFSFAEALIVMCILSVFFAFGARVVTQKPKPKIQQNNHGYFECYYSGTTLKQRTVIAGNPVDDRNAPAAGCYFELRPGIVIFSIRAKINDNGFYYSVEPNINRNVYLNFSNDDSTDYYTITDATGGNVVMQPNIDTSTAELYNNALYSFTNNIMAISTGASIYNNGEDPLNGIFINW